MSARYSVVRRIADGGMAEIFLGTQRGAAGFERPVVLKRLRRALVDDPAQRDALLEEALIARGLNHANIVPVLDLAGTRGRSFLVLEPVHGWDLQRLLRRAAAAQHPLPLPLAVHLAAEVCRGLAYLHSRSDAERPCGVVHCDVSPHNVLVSEEGEVKLTDFGIAIAGGARPGGSRGAARGKAGFMSPEQAAGEALDPRSDLYSLGSTLYLLVTGRRPYEASSEDEVLRLNRRGCPPRASELRADLPPEVAAVVDRAMRRSPADRYPAAEAMLAALEDLLRAVLAPASATGLKRWLAELGQRDGEAPATRIDPLLDQWPGAGLAGEPLELGADDFAEELEPARPPPPPPDALLPAPDLRALSSSSAGRRGAAAALALVAAATIGGWGFGRWPERAALAAQPRALPSQALSEAADLRSAGASRAAGARPPCPTPGSRGAALDAAPGPR